MVSESAKVEERTLVVVYEQYFTYPESASAIKDSINESLETMRQQAGARVIGSYELAGDAHAPENKEWLAKGIYSIDIPEIVVTSIEID